MIKYREQYTKKKKEKKNTMDYGSIGKKEIQYISFSALGQQKCVRVNSTFSKGVTPLAFFTQFM